MVADGAALGARLLNSMCHHAPDGVHHGLVVTVLHHQGSKLAVQVAEQQQVAVTHLVEYRDGVALAIVGVTLRVDGAHIGDIAAVTNCHVVQVVADILNQAVVADGHVAQRGIVDAAVFHKAVGDFDSAFATAQACPAVELHTMAALDIKLISYSYFVPVLSPAVVLLQRFNLLLSQLEVFFHIHVVALD